MEIRRARPDDVDAALEVWRASRAATGSRPSAALTEQVRGELAAPDAVLVVADDGGQVPGAALGQWGRDQDGAGDLEEGLLHLALLVVHPRARRAGVGTALVEGLADHAYGKGARRLTAWAGATEARAFLEAVGLEPTGRERDGGAVQLGAELDPPTTELVVRDAGLRLGQLLKLAGLVDTGSEGKALLAAGGVQVNGDVELRRGRQLADGDTVVARDRGVRVVGG